MKILFLSLASGSSGNSYYIGTEKYGILIDAGIGARTIKKRLKENGIGIEKVRALFLTHDHNDHVKGSGAIGEKYHIPVYTTHLVHQGIEKNPRVPDKLYLSKRYLYKNQPLMIEEIRVTAFEVPHDGTDNVGYFVEIEGVTFAFATDLGHIPTGAASYLGRANYLILEANYDLQMLHNGPYPVYLQDRIKGERGHLCNEATAQFLANSYHSNMKHVWLCHLSIENNEPEVALQTISAHLQSKGIEMGKDLPVEVLKRNAPTPLFTLEHIQA